MDFGALPRSRPFNSELAPIHPGSVALLARENPKGAGDLSLFIGGPQWTIPGVCKTLAKYSEAWNSIELNTAFYRTVSSESARGWASETPADFRFFVKVHQELSHEFSLWGDRSVISDRLRRFREGWSGLGKKWDASFLQLPPGLGSERMGLLENWLSLWGESPLFIEFRHESWFKDRQLRREAARVLAAAKVGSVCTDTPGRRDASHGTLTTPELFVRFLARSLESDSGRLTEDEERLDAWIERIDELRANGLQRVIFFLHTTDHFWVPELTRRFTEKLQRRGFSTRPSDFSPSVQTPQLSLF
jgi:uncharacterized protein YecE (DUF72 family)